MAVSPRLVLFVVALLLVPLAPSVPATGGCPEGAPVNDCFDAPIDHFGMPLYGDNAGATTEPGEPAPCGNAGKTLWFRAEPISEGQMHVQLDAQWYATLAVYTGAAVDSLSLLTCATSWEDEGIHSPEVWFDCTIGETYRIQVGGMDASTIDFALYAGGCALEPTVPTEPRWSGAFTPVGGNRNISMSWVGPWWDGGDTVNLTHYNVYRAPTCAGAFSLIGSPVNRGYRDDGLEPASTWCYRLTAVNSVGESEPTTSRSATVWDYSRPPASIIVAPCGDGELKVTWSASPDQIPSKPPFLGYSVYGAEAAEGPFALIGSTATSTTNLTEGGLGQGVTRFYRVTSLTVVGEGAASAVASSTTWLPPGPPRDVIARFSAVGIPPLGVTVSWSPPVYAPGLTGYEIYRASSGMAQGQLVGLTAPDDTSFTDGGRGPFLTYYYFVKAVNPAGRSGESTRSCIVVPFETASARCE